jgi:hypothetical protein
MAKLLPSCKPTSYLPRVLDTSTRTEYARGTSNCLMRRSDRSVDGVEECGVEIGK